MAAAELCCMLRNLVARKRLHMVQQGKDCRALCRVYPMPGFLSERHGQVYACLVYLVHSSSTTPDFLTLLKRQRHGLLLCRVSWIIRLCAEARALHIHIFIKLRLTYHTAEARRSGH